MVFIPQLQAALARANWMKSAMVENEAKEDMAINE